MHRVIRHLEVRSVQFDRRSLHRFWELTHESYELVLRSADVLVVFPGLREARSLEFFNGKCCGVPNGISSSFELLWLSS